MTTQHTFAAARGGGYWEFGVKAPSLPDPVPVGRRYAEILAAATPGGQVMARRIQYVRGRKGCGHQADETVGDRGWRTLAEIAAEHVNAGAPGVSEASGAGDTPLGSAAPAVGPISRSLAGAVSW